MVRWVHAAFGMAAVGLTFTTLAAQAEPNATTRTFRFTYTATVEDLPANAKTLDLWIPYPQTTDLQTIHQARIEAPTPVTLTREPIHGNEMAYFRVDNPRKPFTVTLSILATRRENSGSTTPPSGPDAHLGSEPLVPTDGPVGALAREAVRGKRTPVDKARALYQKVTTLLKYDKSGDGWGRGDAVFACDAKRGNCTDFHALIIGMARSQQLPARFAIGFPLPEKRGSGEIPGYHCWAEIYARPQGWIPVDSSEGAKALARNDRAKMEYYFGHHDENRLEFSRGRHLTLAPPQQGEPINFFVYPYAEVDGRTHTKVRTQFRFEDVQPTVVDSRR